jgi:hypothetical protein
VWFGVAVDPSTDVIQEPLGREAILAELATLLESAHGGRGWSLLVLGEAGMGKSTLAEAAASRATAAGFRVAWGWCSAAEMPPYWPWRRILRELLDEAVRARLVAYDPARASSPSAAVPPGRGRSGARCFTARQVRRLLLRRWPLLPAGLRGPSWATSGREHADQPARDGGKDRGERVRHGDPVVDERRPSDATNDEVQAKSRHDRDVQPIGKAARAPLELHLHHLYGPWAPLVILLRLAELVIVR